MSEKSTIQPGFPSNFCSLCLYMNIRILFVPIHHISEINQSTTLSQNFFMILFFPIRIKKSTIQPRNDTILACFCSFLSIHFLCYIDAINVWKSTIQPGLQFMFYSFHPFSKLHTCHKCLKNLPFNRGFYLIFAVHVLFFLSIFHKCLKNLPFNQISCLLTAFSMFILLYRYHNCYP